MNKLVNRGMRLTLAFWTICGALTVAGDAKELAWRGAGPGGGNVSLPYVLSDNFGIQWDVQADGSIGDGGRDLYDGGGHLFLDGGQQFQSNNQASFDEQRNEVTLGPINFNGVNISRRLAVNKEKGFCRWAEVLENPTNQKVVIGLRIYFNMGGMIQFAQPFADEKHKGQVIGYAIGDQRHSFGVVGAGRGAKVIGQIQPQQGSDNLNILYNVEVPPRNTAVIVHVQTYRNNFQAAQQTLSEIKEKEYLAQLPKELLRKVVNFRACDQSIGENLEVLRGDALTDVIELRSGDQLRGTLKDRCFRLQTSYGSIQLPAGKVVGVVNVGAFKPRQLVVTNEGEVFGGYLDKDALSLELSSGQAMEVPLTQLARAGYRKRVGEPEEWKFDKPLIQLRGGDRIQVQLPEADLDVSTRYGPLKLRPASVASISFAAPDGDGDAVAHRIRLADGSEFTGIVTDESFQMRLAGPLGGQPVTFPASAVARLQLSGSSEIDDDTAPTMAIANGDNFVGALAGALQLETSFDTLTINAGEVKRLSHVPETPADVQVTLWDDSIIQGQFRQASLSCQTLSGTALNIPIALIDEYRRPRPQPSEVVVRTIGQLVEALNSDDWQSRDSAQQKLLGMGPVVISTLKVLRDKQPPEAQQRIDLIVPQIEKQGGRENPGGAGAGAPQGPERRLFEKF